MPAGEGQSRKFGCPACQRRFPSPLGLELHGVRVHHQRGIADGSEASNRTSAEENDASGHASARASEASIEEAGEGGQETAPTPALTECQECPGLFPDEEALSDHLETAHAPPEEPEPASEDEVVREVADGLPSSFGILTIGSDRLGRVRWLLAEARRKSARHPGEDDDSIQRRFWDGNDRRILEALRAKGVRLRVEDGVDGG
jgi:hypothetical protein